MGEASPLRRITRAGCDLPAGALETVAALERYAPEVHLELDWPLERLANLRERRAATRVDLPCLFADTALTRIVVCWMQTAGPVLRRMEFAFPQAPGPALAAIAFADGDARDPQLPVPRLHRDVAASIAADAHDLESLAEWMAGASGAERAREVWRAIGRLSVIADAEDGLDSVLALVHGLATVQLHALDRFRECLNDLRISADRRRPEYLRDLRVALSAAEAAPRFDPRRYALRRTVQRNLHLVVDDARRPAALAWIGSVVQRSPVLPRLDANLYPPGEIDPVGVGTRISSDGVVEEFWRRARDARLEDQAGHDYAAVSAQLELVVGRAGHGPRP